MSTRAKRVVTRAMKIRRGLAWAGGAVGAAAVAATVVLSLVLIAPGTTAMGADLGWRTSASARDAVDERLAELSVTVASPSGDVTLSGRELGLTAEPGFGEQVLAARPLWNVSGWNAGAVAATPGIDTSRALEVLAERAPSMFAKPVDAAVTFSTGAAAFVIRPAEPGSGVDPKVLEAAVLNGLGRGDASIRVESSGVEVQPTVPTSAADESASRRNAVLDAAGLYIGTENAVPLDRARVASWIIVQPQEAGFAVTADATLIDRALQELAPKTERPVVDSIVVTNSKGDVLHTLKEGQNGWKPGSMEGAAAKFAAQLAAGDGKLQLPGEVTEHKQDAKFRRIDVDKSTGLTTLYENEQVVTTFSMAVGKPETPTHEGRFTVYGQLTTQDMGDCNGDFGFGYCTPNVPWVTYFNGDEGFHGTYWHNNFGPGAMMSHGCVNLTIADAEYVYRFAQVGTEVWVH